MGKSAKLILTELVLKKTDRPNLEKAVRNPEAAYARARKRQSKPLPLAALHKKYDFTEMNANGTSVYVLHSRKQSTGHIVLYFPGGGYMLPGDEKDFAFGQDMADNTGAAVWLVWYPLFPDTTGGAIVNAALDAYRQALNHCKPEQISLFGLSTGASLSILACLAIRDAGLPMPGRLVPFSPCVRIPPSSEQERRMLLLDKQDCMIPAEYVLNLNTLQKPFDVSDCPWFFSPIEKSWEGFPPMLVCYGGNEVLSAQLPEIKSKCRAEGVPLTAFVGRGLMHCWVTAHWLPERRSGRETVYAFLQGDTAPAEAAAKTAPALGIKSARPVLLAAAAVAGAAALGGVAFVALRQNTHKDRPRPERRFCQNIRKSPRSSGERGERKTSRPCANGDGKPVSNFRYTHILNALRGRLLPGDRSTTRG